MGGVVDTVESLHFPGLLTQGIPATGKSVLREFVPLRASIVADANLVLSEAGEVTACKESLDIYLADVVECRDRMYKVIEGLAEENANVETAIDEIIKFR